MPNIKLNTKAPIMMGINEIAEAFGISQHYTRQLALSGTVKAVRVGKGKGKILINYQSVCDFFNNSYINESEEANTGVIKPIPVKLY